MQTLLIARIGLDLGYTYPQALQLSTPTSSPIPWLFSNASSPLVSLSLALGSIKAAVSMYTYLEFALILSSSELTL